jgi:NAD dependent epimerase/dehydratase
MVLTGKKILVTGADGFIGSHLVEKLHGMGVSVKALVCYNALNSWGWLDTIPDHIKKEIEVVSGDVRNSTRMNEIVMGCDIVIHLAALVAIPYSYIAPECYLDVNVKGTLNLLLAAKNAKVSKFIHTSTSEVYGSAQFVPITEEHSLNAQSPYAASKIAADQMALSFYHSYSLPVTVARPFNTYGPRQSMRAIIPTIIAQIASGKKEIKIGSLHPTRDFNYIDDTVNGFVALAEADDVFGEVINLGSNYEISIGDTVKMIFELMNTTCSISVDCERIRPKDSEVVRLYSQNAKALHLLKWYPEFRGVKGLRQGLEKTILWLKQPENLKCYKTELYNI